MSNRSPLGPVEIVRANSLNRDPAIDVEAMTPDGVNAYYGTHDPKLLKLVAGIEPTRFIVKPLSRMYLAEVLAPREAVTRQSVLAFMASCHEIRIPASAEPMVPEQLRRSSEYNLDIATPQWVEDVADLFGMETVYEVGLAAIQRARLPRPTVGS